MICTCNPRLYHDTQHRYDNQVSVEGICIDICIMERVQVLWAKGIRTTGCCCGHKVLRPWVSVLPEDAHLMEGYKKRLPEPNGHGQHCYYL